MGFVERLLRLRSNRKKTMPCVNSLDMAVIERYLAAEQKHGPESQFDMHTNFYQNSLVDEKEVLHAKLRIGSSQHPDSSENIDANKEGAHARHEVRKDTVKLQRQSKDPRVVCKSVPNLQASRIDGKSRVSFDESVYRSETYSWDVYDRTPIDCKQTQTVLEVYKELMTFKLCEMIVHEQSVQSVNQHISNASASRQQEMTGILAMILSEYNSACS